MDAMIMASTRFRIKRPQVLDGFLLNTNTIHFQICGMNHNIKKNAPVKTGMSGSEFARLYSIARIARIATKILDMRKAG